MDTSLEYVRMCKEAKEIQESWNPQWLDLFIDTFGQNIEQSYTNLYQVGVPHEYEEDFEKDENYIWLPRQDQLQERLYINEYNIDAYEITTDFYLYLKTTPYKYETMEVLWLSFVMSENWNKAWNGTIWKEKEDEK